MSRVIFVIGRFLLSCSMAMAIVSTATAAPPANAQALRDAFAACPDRASDAALAGTLCAHFTAPLDRGQPGGDKIDLFVRKFPARGPSRGQVWLIAGGPGESGASFYPLLATLRDAFADLDLLIPDHRGTGFSDRLCPAEEAASSAGGAALDGAEWGSCFSALNAAPQRARAFSISNAANDLRLMIERYRSASPTWVYGVSYGTQLVLRMLQTPPLTPIRGVILDSLVPPEDTEKWDLSHRSFVVDAVGRRALVACGRVRSCGAKFAEPIETALRALVDNPATAKLVGGDPQQFFGSLLDIPDLRGKIPDIIEELGRGDITALMQVRQQQSALGARFNHYPQSAISVPLVAIISASENNARPGLTRAELATEAQSLLFTSNLPALLVDPGLPTYAHDAAFGRLPVSLPRTLVLQGDMDPKTPFEGALAHVALLQSAGTVALQKVVGAPHYLLLTAPTCFTAIVRDFVTAKVASAKPCAIPADVRAPQPETGSRAG